MIDVNGLSKSFRVAKRKDGSLAALRSLFHREYDTIQALNDVSFHIDDGEIAGYIGPNGAGKSTTIKILSGILHPDGGTCVIDGRVPWKQRREHVRNLGVVFGQRTQLWWDVPVIDSYNLLRDIYSLPETTYRRNLDELTQALAIADLLHTPLRQLSLGQRMRCEIAASLLHGPQLLFLDEPTIGLDAISKLAVRDFIRTLQKERGTTVLLTTHDMNDIEALTDRILLIGKGQLLYDGSLAAVRTKYDEMRTVTAAFESVRVPVEIEGAKLLSWDSEHATWELPAQGVPAGIAQLSSKLQLTDLSSQGATVEEIIARMYTDYHI